MERFEINILGCGSALPTTKHFPSSQVVNLRDKLYMVDCGEGAQIQFRSMGLNFNRLNHIFLSHLHGDHCFGLPGLLSTLDLLEKTGEVVIHGQPDAEKIFRPLLNYFCKGMTYSIRFNSVNPSGNELIFEDKSLKVYTIPLKHRVPTCGFLFEEQPKLPHIIREIVDFYQIPVKQLNEIKKGANFITPEGEVVPNNRLTRPATPPKKYAYCLDTAYSEKIIPIIEGVDLLYHEATFCEKDIQRAKETAHSSAKQAATIALKAKAKKLIIGHFSARYADTDVLLQEACEIFPETILAKENLVCQV
ncbi:MAG: ribonuclease Z [Candidatus Azobacteroides sp.]|nr:ribonuclease Z [Candidatus Azobacteroides sp.]